MTLAFLNLGGGEVLIVVLALFFIIALGNYGKDTIFGYWGSVLLAIFTTPLIAFIILAYVKSKAAKP
jgi:ABC-type transport system involved in multi-copper enzyme maturation permease subunit